MGIVLGSNFTVNTTLPLDDRIVFADSTARDALNSGRRYEGLLCYVVADETNYQLVGGITNSDWVELSGGALPASDIVNTPSGNLAATDVQGALNELQTDINTNASALSTHESDTTSIHGITDTADLLTTSNVKAVTLKDIDGGTASNTSRITVPKNTKTNLNGLTRKEATLVFASDEDKLYVDNGVSLVEVGSGGGALVGAAIQTISNGGTIALQGLPREYVRLVSAGGEVMAYIANGTTAFDEIFIQGTDDANPVIIGQTGNMLYSLGEINYTANVMKHFIWNATTTKWMQVGS